MFINALKVKEALENNFWAKTVLVVGDLILDRYLWGDVNRISPESPVPVVQLVRENEVGGGAANVAMNLAGLGLRVAVAGMIGSDDNGRKLLHILQKEKIDTSAIVILPGWQTITKTRVIGGRQQMLRIDRETMLPDEQEIHHSLLTKVKDYIKKKTDAIILSDYAKGCLSEPVCREIITMTRERKIPTLVDPKGLRYHKYTGATVISPNRKELAEACQVESQPLEKLLETGQKLVAGLKVDFLAVTLGENGIALIEDKKIQRIPALAREVFDVSGAGDTVVATLAAGIVSGLNHLDSLRLANLAAGVVVGRVGTAVVHKNDLTAALSVQHNLDQSDKIISLNKLLVKVENWRAKGERIVFTNGCFDLLHAGHVRYLADAKRLGNHLIVGLNTDRSVRALKGRTRPVIGQDDRARVMAALADVDAVVLFDEDTPLELIKAIRPEVLAKGSDYTENQVVGGTDVRSWNGEVVLIPLLDGKSSTNIVKSIQAENPVA